ncbi:unnamed protein product [Scytosiphon promiscuus]
MKRRVTTAVPSSDVKRGVGNGIPEESLRRLKRLDIYARPKREFQRATVHGAMVTLVLGVAVLALTWRELKFSMKTEVVEQLFVNSTINPTVNVTFDVVFARIPCDLLSVDAEDALGIPLEGLRNDVTSTRLDLDGRPVDDGAKHAMGNTLKEVIAKEEEEAKQKDEPVADNSKSGGNNGNEESNGNKNDAVPDGGEGDVNNQEPLNTKTEDECNCYGAGMDGECCRTCEDVRKAYRRKGWKLDVTAVPACAQEALRASSRGEKKVSSNPPIKDEGCRLAGSLEVTRTEGNFHFAPGYRLHRHASDMSFVERIKVALESFNTTHTINALTFGEEPPSGHASPKHISASTVLEGHHKTVQDTHAMHQYFLQLVPTVYRLTNGATVHSNQYSATEHLKHSPVCPSQGLPGVYFYYQVSPVQALVEEKRRGFLAFLTAACGVVGGVYTILGLINTGIEGLIGAGRGHRSR